MKALAHSQGSSGASHNLDVHLLDVAGRARALAEQVRTDRIALADIAGWAGLLHDLGKYRVEFQDYLRGERAPSEETWHAIYGAAYAIKAKMPMAIAFAIGGHHTGLPQIDRLVDSLRVPTLTPLVEADRLFVLLQADLTSLGESTPDRVVEFFVKRAGQKSIEVDTHEEFLVRMLFSCLVDADFLDTERHFQGRERSPTALDPVGLFPKVERHVRGLARREGDKTVLDARRQIFEACIRKADESPGIFSLTTPTGGGKTLASLSFALKHAARHGLRRVVVVIPFLSIIEQTAREYRKILGEGVVVEHHSAVARESRRGDDHESRERSAADLAAENWDAPIVVTTSVQFLESLFARSPARCRKLHNLARSVVILDEVQTLPHRLLEPTVDVVRELAEHYGTSFVFCSATQPGLARSGGLPSGFRDGEVREIAPEPTSTFSTLNRVRFDLPAVTETVPWDWDKLADRIIEHPQSLTIVNLRRHAVELYQKVRDRLGTNERESVFHLSSAMCAAHRLAKLGDRDNLQSQTIYHALANHRPCRVVSTQVVEAGVDLDFPVVYRALAPLDAIIQSAGRCNREGKLAPTADGPGGRVIVFRPVDPKAGVMPYDPVQMSLTGTILQDVASDPARLATDPDLYADYHQQYLAWKPSDTEGRDRHGQTIASIQEDRRFLRFETVAEKARVIDDSGQAVVVPHGEAIAILDPLRGKPRLFRDDLRLLQRFAVSLREADLRALGDLVRPITDDPDGPLELDHSAYDENLGVKVGERPPEEYVVRLG